MSSCEQLSFLPNSDVIWIESDAEAAPTASDPALTISQVSAKLGMTQRALRFYESRGLVAPRREGQTRFYDSWDIERLALILKAKKLGFTLSEIAQMVRAGEGASAHSLKLSRTKCLEQIGVLERQVQEAEDALNELRRIHTMLSGAPATRPARG
jgi:DNA-binding transcriptional MerR regulator